MYHYNNFLIYLLIITCGQNFVGKFSITDELISVDNTYVYVFLHKLPTDTDL